MSRKTRPHLILVFLLTLVLGISPVHGTTVHDDEGQTITFDHPFSRIISLYPAHTENLVSLGCQSSLIGIGENDDYPAAISAIPRFSYRDNTEKFLAAAPDLLLIRPMISRSQPELIAQLRGAGITVVSLQPTSASQMFSYWQTLGELCGRPDQAQSLESRFTSRLKELTATLPDHDDRPGVYFEAIHSKMKTFAPTAISIYALENGGGRNIAQDAEARNASNIAPYGKERLLSRAEEIDVFLSQVGRMNPVTRDDIYQEPGFGLIKAIRSQRVCLIDEEIVSRPTMRLQQGIEEIHACLYPSSPAHSSPLGEAGTRPPQPQ